MVFLASATMVSSLVATAPPATAASSAATGQWVTVTHGGKTYKVWRPRPVADLPLSAVGAAAPRTTGQRQVTPAEPKLSASWPTAGQADVDLAGVPAGRVALPDRPDTGAAASLPVSVSALSVNTASQPGSALTPNVSARLAPSVHLTVADHGSALAAGVSGVIVSVRRTDAGTAAARVKVSVSYASIIGAYGGDFADRLKLVALPACSLTTPTAAACRKQTPVTFSNDRATKTLVATVNLPAAGAAAASPSGGVRSNAAATIVLAATSGSTGQGGDYSATPIKASDGWSDATGSNAGSFDWSYPVAMPPSIGGSAPALSLNYDSASVDGRTTAENGQVSQVGEGWDLTGTGSAITRSLQPCAQTNATSWAASSDSCVGTVNAAISGGSHSGDLVRDDSDTTTPGGLWRIQSDGGSRVQLLHGAANSNGTADGAYWQVTDPNGTVWLYGADRLPTAFGGTGSDAATYSAWAEPVFGQGSALSGACDNPTTADPTACLGAWKWNLSFKIDPHGNVTRYAYARELNGYQHYSTNSALSKPASYTRGGYLREIDYGWRTTDLKASSGLLADGNATGPKPAATVLFDTYARCLTTGCPTGTVAVSVGANTGGIATSGITYGTGGNSGKFVDTPSDQYCDETKTTACTSAVPTFWSTTRLGAIRTAVAASGFAPNVSQQEPGTPAGYVSVDTYSFPEQFPALTHPGSCNGCARPNLWLAEIDHTGYTTNTDANGNPGGATVKASMPPVYTYGNDNLPNRASVSPLIGQGVLDRYRLYEITDELGSEIAVSYSQGNPGGAGFGCSSAPTPATNATLCYPEYSPDPNNPSGKLVDWFNKYVVNQVTLYDNTGVSPTRTTNFTYLGTPAWHTNDSEEVQAKYRTYDEFRGFGQVETVAGTETPGSNHLALTTYFRGMDQDPTAPVTLTSTAHPALSMRDDNSLAGQVFETQDFASDTSALTDTPVKDVVSLPVDPRLLVTAHHARASGLPPQNAHFSHAAKKYMYTATSAAGGATVANGVRKTEVDYSYLDGSSGTPLPNFNSNGSGNNGELYLTDDLGDNSASGAGDGTVDETCTFTTYADAGGSDRLQWTDYPAFTSVSVVPKGGNCTTTSWTPATAISQAQTFYDGATYSGILTGPGDATTVQAAKSFTTTGTPNWVTTSTTKAGTDVGHDAYGRTTRTTDALGRTTTTSYTPSAGALPTRIGTTNPAGWTSSVTLDQGRGLQLRITDANGQSTDENYDGLGRASAVWIPGHAKAAQPNYMFDDHLFGTLPKRVTSGQPQNILSVNAYAHTATLREDGSYGDSYAILDGYGESVQTQAVTADNSTGRVITDTAYDTLGRVIETVPIFPASGAPSSTWANWPVSPPSVSTTTYDGQDRPLVSSVYATDPTGKRTPVSTTAKSYTGTDRVDTTPPTGGTATTTIADARGRSAQLWQYNASATPTGSHDVTTYGYGYTQDPLLGAQATKTVRDPAGNVWTSISDLLGRTISSQDPDTGTTVSTYDDAGNLLGTADGRGRVLAYDYGTSSTDPLRRMTGQYDGGVIAGYATASAAAKSSALSTALGSAITAANRLTGYTYDKSVTGAAVPNGLGQMTASSRYTPAAAGPYTTGVAPSLGYNPTGKPLGTFTTIPSGDGNGALAGTYTTVNYYTPLTGLLDHTDLPATDGAAKAGFAPETVYNTYNVNGLLLSSGGNADYVVDTTYNQLGQQLTRTVGDYPYQLVQSQQYDPVTARITKTFLDGNAGAATSGALNQYGVDYATYSYDAAGLLTGANDLQNANVSGSYTPGPQTTDLQCFTYDAEGRLTAAWSDNAGTTPSATPILNDPSGSGPAPGGVGACNNAAPTTAAAGKTQTQGDPAPYWQTFAVDNAGDRQSMTDHDIASGTTAGDVVRGYTYKNPSGGQPHTLTSVTNTTGTVNKPDAYTYDSSGKTLTRNVTSGAGTVNQSLSWDAEGRLASVADNTTNKTASYLYDASGTELIRRDPANDQTSLYLAGLELHLKISTNTVTGDRYYSFTGAPVITADQTGRITYEAGNGQGTALTTIDAATGKITARRYQTPYGTARGTAASSWPDDHTFLGKTTDTATGLVDVGARKYDPATGRFISSDPVFQGNNPQAVGGYAYAGNDPASLSDPSGLTLGDMCHDSGGHMDHGKCVFDSTDTSGSGGTDSGGGGSDDGAWQCLIGTHYNGHFCVTDPAPPAPAITDLPPSCPGSERCDTPTPAFGSLGAPTKAEQDALDTLSLMDVLAKLGGYDYAAYLLNHWLGGDNNGKPTGTDVVMESSAMASLYKANKNDIDALVASDAAGATVSNYSDHDWHKVDAKDDPQSLTTAAANVFSNSGSKQDWHLALKDFDVRLINVQTSATSITFQFQAMKYYDFDGSDFKALGMKLPGGELQRLQGVGLAKDFTTYGTSDPITIPIQ